MSRCCCTCATGTEQQPLQTDGTRTRSFPWLATAGFAYLTFSSGMALNRSRGDPVAATFVAFAYADLLLLLCCVRAYERAEPRSGVRDWLKLAVWLLTAALTLSFSYRVAAVMPPAAAAIVWVMGLATVAGGFAAFFCFRTPQELAVDKALNTHDPKQISGATGWPPPPSLPLSNLDDHHTPIIEP
jgi:hypothetical protein